jgi:hypothetical protein
VQAEQVLLELLAPLVAVELELRCFPLGVQQLLVDRTLEELIIMQAAAVVEQP